MKTDHAVRRMLNARRKGKTQAQAAARSGMRVRTARTAEHLAQLPSQLKQPRARTRPNPVAQDWPGVPAQLERAPALQVKPLFDALCLLYPGRYQPVQLRTLQRPVALGRAQAGPARVVIFEQLHQPGRLGPADFTHMDDRGITIAGVPCPHLLYQFALTYSNVEAVHLCFSESFAALAEGLESCLGQLGGVPQQQRTDNLSAAVVRIEPGGERHYTQRDQALMDQYHRQPSTNTPGEAHAHGDVEQAHVRFKEAVDHALRLRGSRDLADRALPAFPERPGPLTQSHPPAPLGRGTRAPVSLADPATRSGPGTARHGQALFHHPGLAHYRFGAVPPDWADAHGPGAGGDDRALLGRQPAGDAAAPAWATPAAP